MDDLDHSVLIAEQDWDYFCTESEGCCVLEAKLAAIEEYCLSDDETTVIQVPSFPRATSYDQVFEDVIEDSQKQSEVCIKGAPVYSVLAYNVSLGLEKGESMSEAGEDEQQCGNECLKEDRHEMLRGNEENDNKSHHVKTTGETALTEIGMDNIEKSRVAITEKERWFVTVNDTPVRLRVKSPSSGQRRRKKGLSQSNGVISSSSPNNREQDEEIIENKTLEKPTEDGNNSIVSPNAENKSQTNVTFEEEHNKASCDFSVNDRIIANINISSESDPDKHPSSALTPEQMQQMKVEDLHALQYWDYDGRAFDEYDKSLDVAKLNNDTNTPKFLLGIVRPTEEEDSVQLLEQTEKAEESLHETQISSFPGQTSGPDRPIFALSSFWDEMEKLTINDILELRKPNNSLTKESIQEERSNTMVSNLSFSSRTEVEINECLEDGPEDDMNDSDYCTHLDDSKPDRSSCEFSTFSDFDDEFKQLMSSGASSSPHESPCLVNSEESWRGESNGIVKLFSESDSFVHRVSETDILGNLLTNEDMTMGSFLLEHYCARRSTPSPVLSISDILEDHCLVSFFDMLKTDEKSDQFQSWTPTSLPFSSLPETYDDFFTDFEVGLLPSSLDSTKRKKTMLPIYSSSRSVVKELPVVEEVIPTGISCLNPPETSHMGFITGHRGAWRFLSLRRSRLLMGKTWCTMASSWGFPKIIDAVYNNGSEMRSSVSPSNLPILLPDDQVPRQMINQEHDGTTVARAVLLANVSTISAIQYLRRYIKEDEA